MALEDGKALNGFETATLRGHFPRIVDIANQLGRHFPGL